MKLYFKLTEEICNQHYTCEHCDFYRYMQFHNGTSGDVMIFAKNLGCDLSQTSEANYCVQVYKHIRQKENLDRW